MNALSIRKMKEKAPGKLLNCIKEAVAIGLLEHPEKLTLDKRLFLLLPEDKQEKVTRYYKEILHNLPEDIDTIFKEFDRVSTKGFILSLSHVGDEHKGLVLHMTVESEQWWLDKIKNYGEIKREGLMLGVPSLADYKYIVCVKG